MKKRLLSAALALAMVLTLLPVGVFAADGNRNPPTEDDKGNSMEGKTTVTYAAKNNDSIGVTAGDWYWSQKVGNETKYYTVSSGVVASTGNSGRWYSSLNAMLKNGSSTDYVSTTITLLQNETINDLNQNLTVDVNGKSLIISAIDPKVTSLKVSDSRWNALNPTGTGSLSIVDMSTSRDKSGMTLTLSNITVDNINIKARANTINLTSVEVGAITLDGETKTYNNQGTLTSTTYATQKITATGGELTGDITITNGDSSTVSLQDTNATGHNISLTSNGGGVTIGGTSVVGNITVGSRQNGDFKAVNVPSVIVNGGTVNNIERANDTSTTAGVITIGQANSAVRSVTIGSIKTWNGTVTINQATVNSSTTVGNGSLTINGPVKMGNVVLADNASQYGAYGSYNKVALNVTGSRSSIGDIAFGTVNEASTVSIPDDRTNTFGNLSLGKYAGKGIKGGAFQYTPANADAMLWFDDALHFTRKDGSLYYYYDKNELSDAIADLKNNTDKLAVLAPATPAGNPSHVQFMNGNLLVAILDYNFNTSVILPNKINGTPVVTWTDGKNDQSAQTYPINKETPLIADGNTIQLNVQSDVGAVTKLINATTESDSNNPDVRVTVSNNQINLSGAVSTIYGGGDATIIVTFYTDLVNTVDSDTNIAKYVSFRVPVTYNPTTRTGAFGTLGANSDLPRGVVVKDTTITVGNNVYTLNVSGLGVPAANIKVDESAKGIQVNFSGSGWTDGLKRQVTDIFEEFDWTNSTAIRQAVNEALKGISNATTVNGYRTAAQRAAWTLWNSTSPNEANLTSTLYNQVYLVPYLNVTVSQYLNSGTLTFTAVPSYRIEVRGGESGPYAFPDDATHPNRAYIAKPGTTLGNLDSELVLPGAVLKLKNLPETFNEANLHQDSTYVYTLSSAATANNSRSYTITHGGNAGLGSMSLNNNDYSVRVDTSAGYRIGNYTSLQAAANDTKPRPQGYEDVITIESNYTGTQTLSLTGEARTIKVVSNGNTNIVAGASGTIVTTIRAGHEYQVQLLKNTVAPGQNIIVASATGGSASVNVNPATVGQTVTITLRPNTGYVSNGVTVRTNATTGTASTNVPVTGSGNTYTFTMPAGSVTVTPAFRQGQTQTTATVTVSSPNTGSAVTSALNNQVTPGSVVTVTTYPASGQRTMGLNVSTNGGSTTAVRTGVNTFQFTVPSNATNVVVTPTFDVNNNTVFSDVWAKEYYSNPVAWAVSNGVTDGTSTYTFSPNNYCTRAQMVTFLWRAAGRPPVTNIRNPFVDVSPTLTPGDYYSAILWAVSEGITDGKTATRFAPNDIVTRGQAVTFLYRFEKQPPAGTTSQFYDVPSTEYYAKPVSWAANRAVPITTGKTNTMFDPNAAVTRAQAVTFLYRDRTNKLA